MNTVVDGFNIIRRIVLAGRICAGECRVVSNGREELICQRQDSIDMLTCLSAHQHVMMYVAPFA